MKLPKWLLGRKTKETTELPPTPVEDKFQKSLEDDFEFDDAAFDDDDDYGDESPHEDESDEQGTTPRTPSPSTWGGAMKNMANNMGAPIICSGTMPAPMTYEPPQPNYNKIGDDFVFNVDKMSAKEIGELVTEMSKAMASLTNEPMSRAGWETYDSLVKLFEELTGYRDQ
jgi:hypothetical protein